MNNYIKSEDAVIEVERFGGYLDDDMLYRIKLALSRLPSADVVEVVRCGICEHWKCNPTTDKYGVCKKASYDDFEVVMESDDFCSYGERKEKNRE